jgi:hypothetical protein
VTAITAYVIYPRQYLFNPQDLVGKEGGVLVMSLSELFASIVHRLRLRHPDFEQIDISKRLRELLDIAKPRQSETSENGDGDRGHR